MSKTQKQAALPSSNLSQKERNLDGWREVKLGEVAHYLNRGYSPKYVTNDGILILNQKCIRNGKIDYAFSRLTDKHKGITSIKMLEVYDILINSTGVGTAGRVGIFDKKIEATADTHISILRLEKDRCFPKYIFYNLRSREDELESIAEGSTGQIELRRERLSNLKIILPPLPEQKAIAEVLSSLDDKIDLLHRQNKTLEEMAQALFRRWFVDNPEKERWEVGKLGDVVDFNPTYQLAKNSDAPYLEMGNVNSNSYAPSGWYTRKFNSGMKFKNGDTLFARITPCLENGKTCFVDFLKDGEIGWGSTEYIVMRAKHNIHPFFCYIIAKNEDFRDFAIASMTGSSGRQRAQAEVLKKYDFEIPPEDIIKELNYHYESITLKLNNNQSQIRTLENLRDTLLPKLMRGEVRVGLN